MAAPFSQAEWDQITARLDADPAEYGLPARQDDSIVMLSWNIRKFSAFSENGTPLKSPGAFDLITRVCGTADLVAIQEVMRDTGSLYELRDRLRSRGEPWEILYSDVTGMAPGYTGMAERMGFLYRSDRVQRGNLASDLSFDRSAVVTNSDAALKVLVANEIEQAGEDGFWSSITAWLSGQSKLVGARLKRFVQFIRTPHMAEFIIDGPNGSYVFYVINAHLVSGQSKTERELEFFALLEWLLHDSPRTIVDEGRSFILMADLNLDFESNVSKRRAAFEEYMVNINREKNLEAKVNFPFLDGEFFTNARGTETFDHIAWITTDTRLPRGRHNDQAGTLGLDEYDYGMFNFVRLFQEAGPGAQADGSPDYDRYVHDFTDHMPIWVRLPRPHAGQADFTVAGN